MGDPVNTGIQPATATITGEPTSTAPDIRWYTSTVTKAPPDPFVSFSQDSIFAWTASTATWYQHLDWVPMTYKNEFFYASANFFDTCPDWEDPKDCAITYTECSDGTMIGPMTTSECSVAYPYTVKTSFSKCLTDLYYTTYGAKNPLSRARCGPAYDDFTVHTATIMYRESPTVPVPAIVQTVIPTPIESPSKCDSFGRPCKDYSMNPGVKAAIAVGVVMGVMAIVVAILVYRSKKIDKRQAVAKHAANEFALEEGNLDALKPPNYNVAVAEERGAGSSSGNAPAAVVPNADPPPYRP